jgi:hypothetical protein
MSSKAKPTNPKTSTASSSTPSSNVSAKEKLKARRRVMQDIRGNRSNMKTLDQVSGLPQRMQMDAVRQVSAKGRKGTKPKATVKPSAETVAQSTADVRNVIKNANSQVLQTAIDQHFEDALKLLPPEMTRGLDLAEVKAGVEVHFREWIETGKFPDDLALQGIVRSEFHKKLNIPEHFDHADNETNSTSTSTTEIGPPTGLLPPTNPTNT